VSIRVDVVPAKIPPIVDSILMPSERRVITVRLHPAMLVGPTLAVIGGLIAASVLSFLNLGVGALAITWAAWGFTVLYSLARLARWPASYFIVTDVRFVLIRGILARDVVTVPLARATNLALRRSFAGRLFGYGEFVLYGAVSRQAIRNVKFLPYPEQLYLEVMGLIFKDPHNDDDW
jgi:hypothetical protein